MKLTAHFGALLPPAATPSMPAPSSPRTTSTAARRIPADELRRLRQQGPIVGGIWYRGILGTQYRDAFIVTLGIQSDVIKFGYSYDVTVSDLTPATGGSHEVSMALNFDCRAKRIKFPAPLPRILNPFPARNPNRKRCKSFIPSSSSPVAIRPRSCFLLQRRRFRIHRLGLQ